MVPFPALINVTPTSAPVPGGSFAMNLDPTFVIDQAFLSTAAVTIFDGFVAFLTEVTVTIAQVEMASKAGCSEVCVGGSFNVGGACTADVDCDEDGNQPYTGQCIGPPASLTVDNRALPVTLTVPNAPWPCSSDADCQDTNSSGTGICCTGAGAPNANCTAANECDPTTVPTQVTGGIELDNFDPVPYSCTVPSAAVTGDPVGIAATGIRAPAPGPADPATETYVRTDVGALTNVSFDCEAGTAKNPNTCTCPGVPNTSPITICQDTVNCVDAGGATCVVEQAQSTGDCIDPVPFTLKYDPIDTICDAVSVNAGESCTADTQCDAPCDTDTDQCADGTTCGVSGIGILNPDVDCDNANAGGGTCIPSTVIFLTL
jgi:hypothetical protein